MATEIYLGYPPENIVNWIKAEAERKYQEMLKEPLCFTAEEGDAAVCLDSVDSGAIGYREINIVTSTDKQNWTPYGVGTEITLTNIGDKVYFRAADNIENWTFNGYRFHTRYRVAASGNLNTLLKADGSVLDFSTLKDGENRSYCYSQLFYECTDLTQAPELPATTLAEQCYYQMFYYCTSLTQAPELPATTLADGCYYGMFASCTYLTHASELPATTLAYYCYGDMFNGCQSLSVIPSVLPATTLADYCYDNMFAHCISLTKAPELPATTLASNCYNNMFNDCTSLTSAPVLPATTLAEYCYFGMFSMCESLTNAPVLPATTLAEYCYNQMFNGTSLTQAPELPATELADYCYCEMFSSCGYLTQAPELPATTLANSCYEWMFAYCESLTQASFPNLEKETVATEVVENQYAFEGAASDIEATCKDGILIINSTAV